MSRHSTLCREKLIYYTSIKQRERKCFRQIIVGDHGLKRAISDSLRAYTGLSSCCQIHVSPRWFASFATAKV